MNDAITIAAAIAEEAEKAATANHDRMIAEIEELEGGLVGVEQYVANAKGSIGRIKAAAKQLVPSTKKKTHRKKNDDKPRVTKEVVRPVCLEVAKDNPSEDIETLKELAKDKLVIGKGYQENGAALQVQKCFGSNLFIIGSDGTVTIAPSIGTEVTANGSAQLTQ